MSGKWTGLRWHVSVLAIVMVFGIAVSSMSPGSALADGGYKLPWPSGTPFGVSQAWNTTYTHKGIEAYAYDFKLPESTPVLASKSGVVTHTVSGFTACGGSTLATQANLVTIKHDDGTATFYLHLSRVDVTKLQQVSQGQQIGLSGKTGYTNCGPHLHFQRQAQGTKAETQSTPIYFDEYPGQVLAANVGSFTSQNAGTSQPCQPSADQVAIYADANFAGTCAVRGVGSYNDPGSTGLGNDSMSSLRVGSNVRLVACRDSGMAGACATFTGNVSAVGDPLGNDQMSSMKVEFVPTPCNPTADQVAIFADGNFSGTCAVRGVGTYNDPGSTGLGNDSMSSLRVGSNVRLVACRDSGMAGTCATFTGDVSAVGDPLGNDQMSSMKVELVPTEPTCQVPIPGPDQVVVFEQANFGGHCSRMGIGNWADSGATGIANDSMSSLKVGANVLLHACDGANFGDPCQTFDTDVTQVGGQLENDRMSSFRVVRRQSCEPGTNEVAVFEYPNFVPPCAMRGVGDYPSPESTGISNDSLSSVKIGAGVQLVICGDANFGASCQTITSGTTRISGVPQEDQMSSMRVVLRELPVPGAVSATALDSGTIRVAWGNVAGETGYEVSAGSTPRAVSADVTSLDWGGLPGASRTCFTVRAVGGQSASPWSAPACATTSLDAPAYATATALDSSAVRIAWGNVSGETEFQVWDGVAAEPIRIVAADVTSYEWRGLSGNTTKCLTVRSVSRTAERMSGWTPAPCVTTPEAADTQAPTVSWSAPVTNGGVFNVSTGSVALAVTSTDNIGTTSVSFDRWNAVTLQWVHIATDSAAPFQSTFDAASFNPAWNQVNATATDAAGNSTTMHVWIYKMQAVDTQAPTVSWSAPVTNGGVFNVSTGSVVLAVTSTDNVGTTSVSFDRWNAVTLQWVHIATDSAAPFQSTLDVASLNPAWNQVNATATDAAGNSTTMHVWIYKM